MAARLAKKGPNSLAVKGKRERRGSVSAESYNPDQEVTKVFHAKSDEARAAIRDAVKHNFLFVHLDAEQELMVVDAMEEKDVADGEVLIKQGDDGDFFYVVAKGRFDIFRAERKDDPPQKVLEVGPGRSFGELALMYNAPRAATCISVGPSKVWALDRQTFNVVVMGTTIKRRQIYEEILSTVPVLQTLSRHEISKICDVLTPSSHSSGDVIVRQGDDGDLFYIIESGTVRVSLTQGSETVSVGTLSQGQYFGEVAVIGSGKRTATVTAEGPLKLVFIDKAAFVRLLNQVVEVFRTNMANYLTFESAQHKEREAAVAQAMSSVLQGTDRKKAKDNKGEDLLDYSDVVVVEGEPLETVHNGEPEDHEWVRIKAAEAAVVENGGFEVPPAPTPSPSPALAPAPAPASTSTSGPASSSALVTYSSGGGSSGNFGSSHGAMYSSYVEPLVSNYFQPYFSVGPSMSPMYVNHNHGPLPPHAFYPYGGGGANSGGAPPMAVGYGPMLVPAVPQGPMWSSAHPQPYGSGSGATLGGQPYGPVMYGGQPHQAAHPQGYPMYPPHGGGFGFGYSPYM